MIKITGKYTTASIMIDEIEDSARIQIEAMVNHPAFTNPVSIMPDTHMGKGAVIGFTMLLTDKVVPNVIGVDIGCGMMACRFIGDVSDLKEINRKIRRAVPLGFNNHNGDLDKMSLVPDNVVQDTQWLIEQGVKLNKDNVRRSIGTLGGGNHFIEISKSESGYWIVIHSGSRGFGKNVAEFWQNKANNNHQSKEDLNYLENDEAKSYLAMMLAAQQYANLNRRTMIDNILKEFGWKEEFRMDSVHNYVNFQDNIVRKGATSAQEGELLIIPLNMRDGVLLCKGKGNKEWNYSAPHGAGRVMGRKEAKRKLNIDDFTETMKGVYSTSVNAATLDEAPMAYKKAELIKSLIPPTCEVIETLYPILNIKA